MSADNWTYCPKCKAEREDEISKETRRIAASYGSVSIDEFDAARSLLADKMNTAPEQTWREDYEFYGVEDGVLHIVYRGGCKACGFAFKHQSEHPLVWP